MKKSLSEIQEIYDLELDRVVSTVEKQKAKFVLLQFPEGLKPYAQVICDYIEENCSCNCFIWMGSCYGACDLPLEVERLGIDLIVQFGHSKWNYKNIEIL
jgi:2-(3-amino-3-carboxypropyl)histidine synthase